VFGAMPSSEEASTLEASKTPNRYCKSFSSSVVVWTVWFRRKVIDFSYMGRPKEKDQCFFSQGQAFTADNKGILAKIEYQAHKIDTTLEEGRQIE
jgi:hypothetical protein